MCVCVCVCVCACVQVCACVWRRCLCTEWCSPESLLEGVEAECVLQAECGPGCLNWMRMVRGFGGFQVYVHSTLFWATKHREPSVFWFVFRAGMKWVLSKKKQPEHLDTGNRITPDFLKLYVASLPGTEDIFPCLQQC